MARTEVFIAAPPEQVFSVLSDAAGYGDWVVGSREVRTADAAWPTPGSAFGHTIGFPPLAIKDETVVLEAEPPDHLRLEVKARPLPSVHVSFALQPRNRGTQVTMIEDLADPRLNVLAGPVVHALLRLRNAETLRRLKTRAERRDEGAHRRDDPQARGRGA